VYVYGDSFTTKKENPVAETSNCPQEQTFTVVLVSLSPFLTIPIRNETKNLTESDDDNKNNFIL